MPSRLLASKTFVPQPRATGVPRPRLRRRLDAAVDARLILVSAPAGFGKTTLLAEWLSGGPAAPAKVRRPAWVSLERGDSDPASFWTYVITALRTVAPGVGAGELTLLASPRPPPIRVVLTTLLNDLSQAGSDIVLVLDDFHLVEAREVHDALAFLIDHLPPRLQLVIAGRADPALPLALLRGRGDLVELRAADLRFTPQETAAYLTGAMGLPLTQDEVAVLEDRTEGWIAALQLAALSMQGRADAAGLLAGFDGDDRYIVDYLVEEVLDRQPRQIRDFLLQTSLLSELNGPLCEAVTGQPGGRAMLGALERADLFVVPLDPRRESYRYHHLFADVLRARLTDESPDLVRVLHRRASDWYSRDGRHPEAVEHAIAGQHYVRAADLTERAMPALRKDRQEAVLRRWLELLPEEVLAARPALSNGYAGALLAMGEGVDQHLRAAERGLDQPVGSAGAERAPGGGDSDADEHRRLPAAIAVHRAGLALLTGDRAATVAHARRALDLLEQVPDLLAVDRDLGRAAASALLGLASWSDGQVVTAHEAYLTSVASMRRAGHVSDVLGLSLALADIQLTRGDLRGARRTYEQALRLVSQRGGPAVRGTADMHVGLSVIHLERDDLPRARQSLDRAERVGEHGGLPQNDYRRRVALAQLRVAEGDVAAAVELLIEAGEAYQGDFSPDARPVAALRAQVLLRQGRLDEAVEWARERELSAQDELSYVREYEHVTLARILLAQHQVGRTPDALDDATALLGRLFEAAEEGRRTGSTLEVLVLQALALHRRGDVRASSAALDRALRLGGPEGYVRVFAGEGPTMAALLAAAAQREVLPEYVSRLLTACRPTDGTGQVVRAPSGQALVEPLSRRELDVLRLLCSDLDGPEIARELVVSLNTVRTHTRHIYAKLAVTNRRAAVRRALELEL
jgi:LuxR family transcriptional regulator, maltose regulon positive regulatory protein